jgi:hypothetical protein
MFSMRPSIPVSQDASERLKITTRATRSGTFGVTYTQEWDVRSFMTVDCPALRSRRKRDSVTKNIFLRGQPNRKLRDRELGPLTIKEHSGNHNCIFQVNNLRPCSTDSLRHVVINVTIPQGDDDEFEVSHISVVCIKSLFGRRGKYLLFMTHFNDDDIPRVMHRLNDVHRTTALHNFRETLQWHTFAQTQAYKWLHARLPNAHHESH